MKKVRGPRTETRAKTPPKPTKGPGVGLRCSHQFCLRQKGANMPTSPPTQQRNQAESSRLHVILPAFPDLRSVEWPAWFSFWFSGCWRALAKGTARVGFDCEILLLLRSPHGTLTLHRALHDGRPGFPGAGVLTGACQFGHGVGGFTTNFIHSARMEHYFSVVKRPKKRRWSLR